MRKTPLKRKTKLVARKKLSPSNRTRRSKGLKKVNPERQAKRRKAYAQKLAAYRRSETYRIVEARAGGQCEGVLWYHWPLHSCPSGGWGRCYAKRGDEAKLTHHHKTYARFGGKELPEDIIVLCDRHNEEAESQYPTRNRGWSRWQARTA